VHLVGFVIRKNDLSFPRRIRSDTARKLSANRYDLYHCCVYSEKQRNCPKLVEFYSKNKFEELVHLVGCIIRIYHDARSPKLQGRYLLQRIHDMDGLKPK